MARHSFKLALPALKAHPLFAYSLLGLDMLADTCRNIWKFRHIHEIFSHLPVLPLGRESKYRNMQMNIIDTQIKTHDVGPVVGKVVLDFSVLSKSEFCFSQQSLLILETETIEERSCHILFDYVLVILYFEAISPPAL